MADLNKKRASGFTLGVLALVAVVLVVEWLLVSHFVHGNHTSVFAILAVISAVVIGTVSGRLARGWLTN